MGLERGEERERERRADSKCGDEVVGEHTEICTHSETCLKDYLHIVTIVGCHLSDTKAPLYIEGPPVYRDQSHLVP